MSVHQTPDSGTNRAYQFRPRHGQQVIRFRVKAAHDANVCLTTGPRETPGSMYEIFLAGWSGKESAIRKDKKQDLCKTKTPNLLNPNQFVGFWIALSRNAIKVGREGEASPFMVHSDPCNKVLNITHYGFCTAYGATGSWTFSDEDPTSFGPGGSLVPPTPTYPQQPPPPYPGHPPPPPTFPGQPPSFPVVPPHPGYPGQQIPPTGYPPSATLPLSWVYCSGGSQCAAPVAAAGGLNPSLVATAYHQGGLIPGIFYSHSNTCHVSWGGVAHVKNEYYLLSNTGGAEVKWVASSGGQVPMGAVEGGYSEVKEKLYIGRVRIGHTYVCGKVHPSHRQCYVPNCGAEKGYGSYEVLCLSKIPLALLGVV